MEIEIVIHLVTHTLPSLLLKQLISKSPRRIVSLFSAKKFIKMSLKLSINDFLLYFELSGEMRTLCEFFITISITMFSTFSISKLCRLFQFVLFLMLPLTKIQPGIINIMLISSGERCVSDKVITSKLLFEVINSYRQLKLVNKPLMF